ncbi:hypothetical protein [Actinacidiphila paucisporea]|uniref:Secreted protein n=1 Tax=Actinacidiphila paucisporea TaxID=310782 RepID=A0A1M7MGL0_9ACTN|nr:hypothetical protein [Actinacidiphila paucisporea]SHM89930.1 hypothetical protein SAMN05216499_11631 [Actinacidiphila paucisporea]
MRRLGTATALTLALAAAPMALGGVAATASAATGTHDAATARPATGAWVNTGETYPQYWICVYVGNQKVGSGQAVNFSCPAGPAGSYALWILTP